MNVHHLELFYYVAKYEGITPAVRKMPYGIQQPAVSAQMLQLEQQLGVKLFNRRPFTLTPAGELLYDFTYPFFSRMADVEERLKGEESKHLRIAASASVLGNHLPIVLEQMKLKMPDLKLTLREVEPSEVHHQLIQQQTDIALSVLHGKLDDGIRSEELLTIPLVLHVPASCGVDKLEALLKKNPDGKGWLPKIPLVGLPSYEILSQLFQDGLRARDISWDAAVEVSSLEVIQKYVSRGFGAGIGVEIPGVAPVDGCVSIPLHGFPPLVVGAIYQGTLKPVAEAFLVEARHYVQGLQLQ